MRALKSVEEAAGLLGISPWDSGGACSWREAELERFVAVCRDPVKTQATTDAATNKTEEASL
jgi:hypothetical protein